MRNAETVLGIVHERGKRSLPLEDVYRQLYNPDLFLRAYGRAYRNDGAMTQGATEETVDGMSMRKIGVIIDLIRHERYRWTPMRRTYIPKKGGKVRPLGIPTWSDKLLQEVMRSLLEAYFEPQFSDHSHGFRPGRGCHTALSEILHNWVGTKWFIEGDIKGCFDNIDHQVLLSILGEKIHDNRFLALVECLLEAGHLEDWRYHPTPSGTPQGGIVSPVLANVYLDRLDEFVERDLIPEFTKGGRRRDNPAYRHVAYRAGRLRAAGDIEGAEAMRRALQTLPSCDTHDPGYRRLRYARYADDFLLGLQGSKEDAEAIKSRLGTFLGDHLKLELSPEKTLVTHARSQPARFLGYDVAVMHDDTRRSLNGHIELRLPPDVLEAKCARYMHHGSPSPRAELTTDSDFDIIALYGAEYRGIVQYYALARNVTWFHRLHWVMSGSLLKTLASKHRSTVREMVRRYASKVITSSGVRRCFQVTVEREGKPPLVARFGGIPLKYDRNATIADEMPTIFVCGTELIQRLLADRCEICGSRVDVEVHHIRKLRDLTIPGRKERPFHVQRMAARRRKTLVVCEDCHKKIHRGQPLPTRALQ